MASDRLPHRLFRYRFVLLAAYLAFAAGAVYFLQTQMGVSADPGDWALVLLIILILQSLFLLGAPHLRPGRSGGGRPMLVSLAAGTLLATLLTVGFIGTALSAVHREVPDISGAVFFGTVLTGWAIWFFLFAVVWAGEWFASYRRLYRMLLAGTVLELLVTIPIDIQVRRRTSCYCGEGTFFALVVGLLGLVWVLGPGIVLLFLARRLQRREAFGYCRSCGYDLRMLPTQVCPECGTVFEIPEAS